MDAGTTTTNKATTIWASEISQISFFHMGLGLVHHLWLCNCASAGSADKLIFTNTNWDTDRPFPHSCNQDQYELWEGGQTSAIAATTVSYGDSK